MKKNQAKRQRVSSDDDKTVGDVVKADTDVNKEETVEQSNSQNITKSDIKEETNSNSKPTVITQPFTGGGAIQGSKKEKFDAFFFQKREKKRFGVFYVIFNRENMNV